MKKMAVVIAFALAALAGCANPEGPAEAPGKDKDKETPVDPLVKQIKDELAIQAINYPYDPYVLSLSVEKVDQKWGLINQAVKESERYVILDISASTATGDTLKGVFFHSTGNVDNVYPTENDCNIIWDNEFIVGVKLPASLRVIGEYAFFRCYNITSVSIPEGVTSIERYAFNICRLTEVVIPGGVEAIGFDAFVCGPASTKVIFEDSTATFDFNSFSPHLWGYYELNGAGIYTPVGWSWEYTPLEFGYPD
jgi:hypothetical protein